MRIEPVQRRQISLTLQAGTSEMTFSLARTQAALAALGLIVLLIGLPLLLVLSMSEPRQNLSEKDSAHYRKRIAHLQGQLERVSSRQVLDADLLQNRIVQLAARQAELEAQGAFPGQLARQAGSGPQPQANATRPPANVPLPPVRPAPPRHEEPSAEANPPQLRRLEGAMMEVERGHLAALQALGAKIGTDLRRIDLALAATGLPVEKMSAPAIASGGPFIPLTEALGSGEFSRKLRSLEAILTRHDRLSALLPAIPLFAPLGGAYEVTSHFGARNDPFHGRAAWHAGIDLRNEFSSDVQATADGQVTLAGWNGAYGLTIEIDHGHGLATRYAHLSDIRVREGQMVALGQAVGRMGSTGRSTGAHLHYEIRIDGRAVDPARFLRAGENVTSAANWTSRGREPAQ
jgi:murein DD-endopeptidase MepM/ murein hydrolase activator NlpD